MNGNKEVGLRFLSHIDPVLQARITVVCTRHDDIEPLRAEGIAETQRHGERQMLLPHAAVRPRRAVVLAAVPGIDHNRADFAFGKRGVAHHRFYDIGEIELGNAGASPQYRGGIKIRDGDSVQRTVAFVERHDDFCIAERKRDASIPLTAHVHAVKTGDIVQRNIAAAGEPLHAERFRRALRGKSERNRSKKKKYQKQNPVHQSANPFRRFGGNMEYRSAPVRTWPSRDA